jgi:4-hydroxy-L-threonine phosphate dehydrogenase PdxA
MNKPVIGISCGDINGIGTELIIKTFSDNRILEQCTPVIFTSNKLLNFYKKAVPDVHFNYQNTRDLSRVSPRTCRCRRYYAGTYPGPGNSTDQ